MKKITILVSLLICLSTQAQVISQSGGVLVSGLLSDTSTTISISGPAAQTLYDSINVIAVPGSHFQDVYIKKGTSVRCIQPVNNPADVYCQMFMNEKGEIIPLPQDDPSFE